MMVITENHLVKVRVAYLGLALALAGALVMLMGLPKPSQAATGDILRTLNVTPAPECSVTVGIAFDGNELLTSCYENQTITRVDPSSGNNLGSYEVSGTQGEGIGAMSWDAEHNQLWIATATSLPQRVYTVQLDKANSTGTATLAFETPNLSGYALIDGLAYDGTDNTIWMSPDVDGTVSHFDQAGNLLGTIDVADKLEVAGIPVSPSPTSRHSTSQTMAANRSSPPRRMVPLSSPSPPSKERESKTWSATTLPSRMRARA